MPLLTTFADQSKPSATTFLAVGFWQMITAHNAITTNFIMWEVTVYMIPYIKTP